ncbi:MAG: oxidoreductase [Chitinophagales bacterium]|nr:oxidoreductase [Chitinophagales bacterium]
MDSQTTRTALLLGASGLIGSHLLDYLMREPRYAKVVVAVRKKLPIINEKLVQVVVDFEQIEQHASELRADDIFCCLGTTMKQAGSKEQFRKVDYEYPLRVAKMGLLQGANQYLLVSSLGADKNSLIFYSRTKGLIEEALKGLGFPSLHIFRPSLLLGERKEKRFGEQIGEKLLDSFGFLLQGALKRYRGIEASTVAHAMMHCALVNEKGTHLWLSDAIQQIHDKAAKQ